MAIEVLLVTEANTGNEAIYVGGMKVEEQSTLYACDIAKALKGMEVVIAHRSVDLMGEDLPSTTLDFLFLDHTEAPATLSEPTPKEPL